MMHINAGEFKAKCLKLMDLTEQKHETIIIMKRGTPIAKLVPYEKTPFHIFGFLKGSVVEKEDVTKPIKETWDAEIR